MKHDEALFDESNAWRMSGLRICSFVVIPVASKEADDGNEVEKKDEEEEEEEEGNTLGARRCATAIHGSESGSAFVRSKR